MGLHVEEHGAGEPLLLIGGLGQGLWAWREQIPVLAGRFRVIAYDTRGTGQSPAPPEQYSIADLADDAADVLAGRRAHVVGLSMGGYVALTLALAHPELVRRLVLIGTGAGGRDRVPRGEDIRRIFTDAIGAPYDEYARRTMPYEFAPGWAEAQREAFERAVAAALAQPTPYETIAAHVDAVQRFYDEGAEVERIEAPALVIHGDEDLIVPVENGRALARRLPNARYVELAGRGHNLPFEDPDVLNALVLEFLA